MKFLIVITFVCVLGISWVEGKKQPTEQELADSEAEAWEIHNAIAEGDIVVKTRQAPPPNAGHFDGCKYDWHWQKPGQVGNMFFKCNSQGDAEKAAVSMANGNPMCHGPHKPGPGFFSHYHPAGHTTVNDLNYHFHWNSQADSCPRRG